MDNDKYQPSEPSLWLCVKISVAVVIILCVAVPALTIFVRTLPFMSPYEPGLGAVTMVTLYIAVPTVILGDLAGADFWLYTSGKIKSVLAHKFNPTAHNTYPAFLTKKKGQYTFVQPVNGELPNVVPQSLHLSPTYHDSSRREVREVQEEQKALPAPLPEPYTLSNMLRDWYPSSDGILLARSAEPGLLTVPIGESLCHTSFTGRTDGGKTTKQRLLLVQLLYLQQTVYLCDKSFRRYRPDKRSNAIYDYRPIEHLLASPPITHTKDVVKLLKELTNELKEQRNTNRFMIKKHKDIYAVFDELPAFAREDKSIMDAIGTLLRESRQYGIFVCGASQDLLNTTLKNDNGAVRENLLTNFYDGGDAATARLVLDLQKNDRLDEAGLGTKGISYLCAKGIALPHTKVRTPLADNMATFTLLGDMTGLQPLSEADMMVSTGLSSDISRSYPGHIQPHPLDGFGYDANPPGQHSDITHDDSEACAQHAKILRILELDQQHKTQSEIIQDVWNAEPNTRSGREAVEELRMLRAQIAQHLSKTLREAEG